MLKNETVYYNLDDAIALNQLKIAFAKYIAGYRPGCEGWVPEDQQAFDAVLSGTLVGDTLRGYTRTVPVDAQEPPMFFALIKKSSKYHDQQLYLGGKPVKFPVVVHYTLDDYVVKGGPGGQYRLADVTLFWRDIERKMVKVKA